MRVDNPANWCCTISHLFKFIPSDQSVKLINPGVAAPYSGSSVVYAAAFYRAVRFV